MRSSHGFLPADKSKHSFNSTLLRPTLKIAGEEYRFVNLKGLLKGLLRHRLKKQKFPECNSNLQVFVQDAPHGREGAVYPLMFDEPGFGRAKFFGVDEDETPRLSEGLQHKRRQPRGRTDGGGRVNEIRGERYIRDALKHVLANPPQKKLNCQTSQELEGNRFLS